MRGREQGNGVDWLSPAFLANYVAKITSPTAEYCSKITSPTPTAEYCSKDEAEAEQEHKVRKCGEQCNQCTTATTASWAVGRGHSLSRTVRPQAMQKLGSNIV